MDASDSPAPDMEQVKLEEVSDTHSPLLTDVTLENQQEAGNEPGGAGYGLGGAEKELGGAEKADPSLATFKQGNQTIEDVSATETNLARDSHPETASPPSSTITATKLHAREDTTQTSSNVEDQDSNRSIDIDADSEVTRPTQSSSQGSGISATSSETQPTDPLPSDSQLTDPQQPEIEPEEPHQSEKQPADPKHPRNPPADPQQPGNLPADPLQSGNPPADPQQSENPPADPQQSENRPADPQQSDNRPTDPQQLGNQPADPQQPGNQPADPQQPENQPADPQQPGNQPADPQQPGNQPADPQQPGNPPADPQQSKNQPADPQRSENHPTDTQPSRHSEIMVVPGASHKDIQTENQRKTQTEEVGNLSDNGEKKSSEDGNGGEVKDSDNVYSTVVSPQQLHKTVSPMNSLSWEEEVTLLKEADEVKKNSAEKKKDLKSALLKSAGISLQHGSEGGSQENAKTQQQNSNGGVCTEGGSVSSEQPPSPGDAQLPSPTTRYDSPNLDDRNLEEFSEILLDSDFSPSDSELQFELQQKSSKQSAGKRVRFADEVEAQRMEGATAEATHRTKSPPPLTGLIKGGGEEVSKHPGVPVSPSSPGKQEQALASPSHTLEELISGVEYSAEYLGSTPIFLAASGGAKMARTFQAQQAVKLIKDPDNESSPRFSVKVKISTRSIKIADSQSNVDLMDHPLHTITYVADINNVLVIMAHKVPIPPTPSSSSTDASEKGEGHIPRLTCHILEAPDARCVALVIGQAFSAAYKEFLRANGITEEDLEEAEYAHILNAQSRPQVEVESFTDRDKTRKLTLAKHKGEMMGIMVMESGYGSAIPACVIAHMSKTGAAARSGLLNVGDHIISINGVSLVGMPQKACIEQIKRCRIRNVVKMVVCSCPAVVDLNIVRPDLKYQLGFSVQDGVICSLQRGSIAEHSGIRVGHRIIEINGTSTVGLGHDDTVYLLSTTVGDLHIRTMPLLMYKLLTGQAAPEYH